jgi:hypothetical protein
MPYDEVGVELVRQALFITLKIAAPILLAGVVVGLIISILQSVTSIQDQTLSFVPKIVVMLSPRRPCSSRGSSSGSSTTPRPLAHLTGARRMGTGSTPIFSATHLPYVLVAFRLAGLFLLAPMLSSQGDDPARHKVLSL